MGLNGFFAFAVRFINMSGGRTCLLFNGYTFFYRYRCRMGQKWCCTLFPRCKSHMYLDENNDILQLNEFHEHVRNYLVKCADGTYIKTRKPKLEAINFSH